jgi:hypothetical protein
VPTKKNQIFRSPNPGVGQGENQAISQATGWRYEHDETDEQINAIEALIAHVREESGAATDNDGRDEQGFPLRGATFSWTVNEDGYVVIGTLYVEDGPADAVVSPGAGAEPVTGKQWAAETWMISSDGTVEEAD